MDLSIMKLDLNQQNSVKPPSCSSTSPENSNIYGAETTFSDT